MGITNSALRWNLLNYTETVARVQLRFLKRMLYALIYGYPI